METHTDDSSTERRDDEKHSENIHLPWEYCEEIFQRVELEVMIDLVIQHYSYIDPEL